MSVLFGEEVTSDLGRRMREINEDSLSKFSKYAKDFLKSYRIHRPSDGKVNVWRFGYNVLHDLSSRDDIVRGFQILVYWIRMNTEHSNKQRSINLNKEIFQAEENRLILNYDQYDNQEELIDQIFWILKFLSSHHLHDVKVKESWFILTFNILDFDNIIVSEIVTHFFNSLMQNLKKINKYEFKLIIHLLNNTKEMDEYLRFISKDHWIEFFRYFCRDILNQLNFDKFLVCHKRYLCDFLSATNEILRNHLLSDHKSNVFCGEDIGKIRKISVRLATKCGNEHHFPNLYRSAALAYFNHLIIRFKRELRERNFETSISTFIDYCILRIDKDVDFRRMLLRTLKLHKQYDIYNSIVKKYDDERPINFELVEYSSNTSFVRYGFEMNTIEVLELKHPNTLENILLNDLILFLWQRDWMYDYNELLQAIIPNEKFRKSIVSPGIFEYQKFVMINQQIYQTEIENESLSCRYYQLPLLEGEYKIYWIDEIDEVLQLLNEQLIHEKVLSLDCEWLANTMEGFVEPTKKQAPISLLQIGLLNKKTYLIDMDKLYNFEKENEKEILKFNEFFNSFSKLMKDKNMIKLGFGFSTDMSMFHRYFNNKNLTHSNFLDLSVVQSKITYSHHPYLVNSSGKKEPKNNNNNNNPKKIAGESVASFTKFLFGYPLDKSEQISAWSRRPLRLQQIIYAMVDAQILIEMARHIEYKIRDHLILPHQTIDDDEQFKYLWKQFVLS
ncbi:hypothetical protein SNEBB_004174 [Seison nebaliae]|nr:hypothetical protein SNEBB_004174 [Seison nebaliae]